MSVDRENKVLVNVTNALMTCILHHHCVEHMVSLGCMVKEKLTQS